MIPNLMNQPITRREVRTLFEILSNTDMYIPESDYRMLIGLSRTHFHYLRKLGRFDNGYHPSCLGGRKRLIHKFYNMNSGRIEIPGLNYTEPITPMRRPRNSSGKKAQKINLGEARNEKPEKEETSNAEQT
ncbi:hypothetical protein R83H12_02374 [Fibrobacteria bacterium R8-3-H12]